jgi:hypothetical protein
MPPILTSSVQTNVQKYEQSMYYTHLIRMDSGNIGSPVVTADQNLFTGNKTDDGWTNLKSSSKIPGRRHFAIEAFSCFLYFNAGSARKLYMEVSSELYFRLDCLGVIHWQAWAMDIPAGSGINASSTFSGDTGSLIATNGMPTPQAIQPIRPAIVLDSGQEFFVNAKFYDIGSKTSIVSTLQATGSDRVVQIRFHGHEVSQAG